MFPRKLLILSVSVIVASVCADSSIGPDPGSALGYTIAGRTEDGGVGVESDLVKIWIFFKNVSLEDSRDRTGRVSRKASHRTQLRGRCRDEVAGWVPPSRDNISLIMPYVESIRHRSGYFNAVSAEVKASNISSIASLPEVRKVESVRIIRRERDPSDTDTGRERGKANDGPVAPVFGKYGESAVQLEMIESLDLLEAGYNGSGSKGSGAPLIIGVLDTGFRLDHEALQHVDVIAQYDFINFDTITSNEPGDPPEQDRHGTLVLGTIAGNHEGDLVGPAWGARYILAKTEIRDQEIIIEEDNWVAAIEWCDTIGADIVTSSVGYIAWYNPDNMDGNTALCTRAADIAASNGVVVCNAVGNYGCNNGCDISMLAPADGDSVLAIGGVQSDETLWISSSRGPTADGRIKPDLVAQGVGVVSVVHGEQEGYGRYNGTSFATPLVAGLCAQLLEIHPEWKPMELRDSLFAHSSMSVSPNNDYGHGIPRGFATSGLDPSGPYDNLVFTCGYPNPFSESISFDIFSDDGALADVSVFDSRGKLVRTLLKQRQIVVGGTLVWDGENNEGRQVASGVYYVEFKTSEMKKIVKVIRIR